MKTTFRMSGRCAALVLMLLSACSSLTGGRGPASFTPPPLLPDLNVAGDRILEQVASSRFDSVSCPGYLQDLFRRIETIDTATLGREGIARISEELVSRIWRIRMKLHDRLPEFDAACAREIRNVSRLLRFSEDYFAEVGRGIRAVAIDDRFDFDRQPVPILEDAPYYLTLRHPDADRTWTNESFRPGDLMITRGVSFLSATISRIGDVESQYSHVVFVNRDEKTGQPETIESYVNDGVSVFPMSVTKGKKIAALKNENARILYLRARDSRLSTRAAEIMSTRTKEAIARGRPIPYDFKLDFENHDELSCAEVARASYEWAAADLRQDRVVIPQFPSVVKSSPAFLKRLGLAKGTTFTPGDLEVDPRFEVVLEWRDLRITRDSRQKDAILTSMLKWMDERGYRLRHSLKSRVAETFVWATRKTFVWPLVKKLTGAPEFPKNMPATQLETVTLLNQLGEKMLERLSAMDRAYEKKHGVPMTYTELYAALERFRARDERLYRGLKTRHKAVFHKWFRGDRRQAVQSPPSFNPSAPIEEIEMGGLGDSFPAQESDES